MLWHALTRHRLLRFRASTFVAQAADAPRTSAQEVESFAADGEELSFWQLQRRVQAVGEALIGWYEIPLKVRRILGLKTPPDPDAPALFGRPTHPEPGAVAHNPCALRKPRCPTTLPTLYS